MTRPLAAALIILLMTALFFGWVIFLASCLAERSASLKRLQKLEAEVEQLLRSLEGIR